MIAVFRSFNSFHCMSFALPFFFVPVLWFLALSPVDDCRLIFRNWNFERFSFDDVRAFLPLAIKFKRIAFMAALRLRIREEDFLNFCRRRSIESFLSASLRTLSDAILLPIVFVWLKHVCASRTMTRNWAPPSITDQDRRMTNVKIYPIFISTIPR